MYVYACVGVQINAFLTTEREERSNSRPLSKPEKVLDIKVLE